MLRERISSELKDAMRARDERKTSTLRLILAAIKDRDIAVRSEGNHTGINNTEIVSLLQKMVKQRQQSIELFNQGARPDLAVLEENEIAIIQDYIPQALSEDEVRQLVQNIIAEINAQGLKDMKKVIEALKEKAGERVDFSKASAIIRDLLSAV
ncbi:MAG: GatB/YqeY domain-containing protein [Alphaproteobacteria bacterium]|nr:GatB/YqeY domain-containing protein [Alphaproteobacteria bacterium]